MSSSTRTTRSSQLRRLIFLCALICAIAGLGSHLVTAQQSRPGSAASADSSLVAKPSELEDGDLHDSIKVSVEIDKLAVRAQEPVTISATADRDCYLNIIHVGRKGKVTFLWPNKDTGWDSRVTANTQLRIPGPRSSFRLQFDGNSPEERIVALACESDGALLSARDLKGLPGTELKTLSKDPMDFMDELWEKLTQKEREAHWGAAELIVQVGESDDRYEGRRTDIRPKVRLHAFSGVPDPSWYLTREQEAALQKMVRSAKSLEPRQSPPVPPDLGYRGFSLEGLQDPDLRGKTFVFSNTLEVEGKKSLAVKSDSNLERWLLDTAGDAISPATKSYVLKLMAAGEESTGGISSGEREEMRELEPQDEEDVTDMLRDSKSLQPKSLSEEGLKAPYRFIMKAPRYEPQRWNAPRVRPRNNCYNYGTNRLTGTYAQPGRYTRRPIIGRIYCDKVRRAVISDGLIPCGFTRRGEGEEQPIPRDLLEKARTVTGHLVAVRVSPGHDYHWFRLDNTGWWSHKPGQSAATDKDRGRKISDPKYSKTYPQFCGYFFVPTHVRVKDEAVIPEKDK